MSSLFSIEKSFGSGFSGFLVKVSESLVKRPPDVLWEKTLVQGGLGLVNPEKVGFSLNRTKTDQLVETRE